MFFCYLAIALIEYHKDEIIYKDHVVIPQKLQAIRLDSISKVFEVVRKAREIKRNIPQALIINIMRHDIFNLNEIDYILSTLNKEICLSIHPQELIQKIYPEVQVCNKKCPLGNCDCFNSIYYNLLVIDCRIDDEQLGGILPNSALLSMDAYTNITYLKNIYSNYKEFKGAFHICLLGSKGFKSKEERNDEEDCSQNMIYNLLQIFMLNEFPYVSVVEGGFQQVHEFLMHYNLQIEKHNRNICIVCNPDNLRRGNIIKTSLKKFGNSFIEKYQSFTSTVRNIFNEFM